MNRKRTKLKRPASRPCRMLVAEALERRCMLTAALAFDNGHAFSINNFSPAQMAVGNLNADSIPDVVVANYGPRQFTSGPIDLALGNGNGTFTYASSIANTAQIYSVQLGDFNGDGKNDVFVLFSDSSNVSHVQIYPGNGNGTLRSPLPAISLEDRTTNAMQVADFNRDGRADLALVGNGGLYIKYGPGNGNFANALVDATSGPNGFVTLAIVDLNGDARPDVVFSRFLKKDLSVRIQNSDGTWQAAKSTPIPWEVPAIASGDFNEDGKLDLALSEWNNVNGDITESIVIKLGDGLGNFTELSNPITDFSTAITVGDFDLDRHLDIAFTSSDGSASYKILRGLGNGQFQATVAGTASTEAADAIFAGDFNRDGRPDLLVRLNVAHQLSTFLNTAIPQGFIQGRLWQDFNQNGNFDQGEPPIGGRFVWADQNDNNIVDSNENRTVSHADGSYELQVPVGTYNVRELLPAGWIETPVANHPGTVGAAYTITIAARQVRTGWNFSSYFQGTVSGYVFNDYNANRNFDSIESGLANRYVYADLDHSGSFTAGDTYSLTGSDGSYHLNLAPGTYVIRDFAVADWLNTDPASYQVTVTNGAAIANLDFGRTRLGGVSGRVYYDTLANSYGYDGDAGIANIRVYIDRNTNGAFDSGEPTDVSDASGNYNIPNQFPGPAIVRTVPPTGRVLTGPAPHGVYNTFIYGGFPGGGGADFGMIFPAYVTGTVFNDKDADGTIDAGEAGIGNIFVFVDYNGNGTPELGEAAAVTDAKGGYSLVSSIGGSRSVVALRPSGYNATLPSGASRTLNLVQGQTVAAQSFGFVQGEFSNAPYLPPINVDTGSNPVSLATGDFNADGKADFVVASNAAASQIYLGQGNGLFTQGTDFATGSATRYMVSIDLNGDGKLDIVSANQDDNAVSVLLGSGDGKFAAAVLYPAALGTYGIAVKDFNNDGKLDIVATGSADSNFAILLGTGAGTFGSATLIPTDFGALSIAAGDVNNDGKPDVVLANQTDSSLTYHAGSGNGTFGPAIRMTAGINQPSFVTLADLNGDGKLDLVYLNEFADQAAIRLGNGSGGFLPAAFFPTASNPRQVAVIDVDRDGKLDLVVSCRSDGTTDISGGVSILRGNGDGTFHSQLVSTAHTSPTAVAIADFNRDGKLDIVAANFFSSDVSLLLNGITGNYGSIAGTLFNDANVNGSHDAGEVGLANRRVFADVNSNGVLDPGERSAFTGTGGTYIFSSLPAGTYRVVPISTSDFVQSSPANRQPRIVALAPGQNVSAFDFELAPTSFAGATVVDNKGARLVGAWTSDTTTPGHFGVDSLTDGNTGKGSKSARFDAALPFDGYYQVFARWTSAANRATNVPFDVVNAFNTRTLTFNQQQNGGTWVNLGVYYFNRASGSVLVRNAGTNGFVSIDAIEFMSVAAPATVAKDNTSAGVAISGSWITTTTPSGYFGSNYLSDGDPSTKGTKSVAFAAGALPSSGVYEVFAWWTAAPDRATNARYDVLTKFGVQTVLLNQRLRGSQWVSLGYFNLDALAATVTIRNNNADGLVVADAVRFVRVA